MIKKLNDNIKVTKDGTKISDDCVDFIAKKYYEGVLYDLKSFTIKSASDNMIGLLSDYWRLEIEVSLEDEKKEILHFFIKSICHNNTAKAAMVNEMKLFSKEVLFYNVIKRNFNINGLDQWSPNFILSLDDAMVYQDLSYLGYKNRNKLFKFDIPHTLKALETLATFHSGSLLFEENKRKTNPSYAIFDDYEKHLDMGGYSENNVWFVKCMNAGLEVVKMYSKYRERHDIMELVEEKWRDVWISALGLCDYSTTFRNVICHRDLWNNNILFRYKDDGKPDSCVFVDFQGIKLQPPAGDVMMLLHCNLDSELREANIDFFINSYYNKLKTILVGNALDINIILPEEEFRMTVYDQRKWGLIASACLIPQIMIDDEIITNTFTDTERFEDIMTRSKGDFIKDMIGRDKKYKEYVMDIFDEIIDRYIIKNKEDVSVI